MNSKETQTPQPHQLTQSEREFLMLLGLLSYDQMMTQIESALTHSIHLRPHIERFVKSRLTSMQCQSALSRIEDVCNPRGWTITIVEPVGETASTEQATTAAPYEEAAPVSLKVDAELGRLAIALKETATFRLWMVAQTLAHDENAGCGWIKLEQLKQTLHKQGIAYSDRHFRRLMKQGHAVFWHYDARTGRLYLRGIRKVSATLTTRAYVLKPALVATNRPGNLKPVYLPLEKSLEAFEAQLYAGWLTAKNAPTIARETLSSLFNRTIKTLRQWEHHHLGASLDILPSFAQIADAEAIRFPEHAFNYVAAVINPHTKTPAHEVRVRWQLPNTYVTRSIRQHAHYGQARRIRASANGALHRLMEPFEQKPLPLKAEGSPICSNRSKDVELPRRHPRRYFESRKQLQRIQRHVVRMSAREGLHIGKTSATAKPSPAPPSRYLFLGRDTRRHNIYEPTETGHTVTSAYERVMPRTEGRVLGKIRGTMYTRFNHPKLKWAKDGLADGLTSNRRFRHGTVEGGKWRPKWRTFPLTQ